MSSVKFDACSSFILFSAGGRWLEITVKVNHNRGGWGWDGFHFMSIL